MDEFWTYAVYRKGHNMIKEAYKKAVKMKHNLVYKDKDRKETFEYIYSHNKWGGKKGEFYSGIGSHDAAYTEPYIHMVSEFVKQYRIGSIVSLGCGDFWVDKQLVDKHLHYEGIDIVDEMIKRNNKKYGAANIHFQCLDIVEDDLPVGELCLIRQVLQHLNNQEIKAVLVNVRKYKYVIITEHITIREKAKRFNVDKVHGQHIRVYDDSGVYLNESPYNLETKEMLRIPYGDNRTEISSVLLINNNVQ